MRYRGLDFHRLGLRDASSTGHTQTQSHRGLNPTPHPAHRRSEAGDSVHSNVEGDGR